MGLYKLRRAEWKSGVRVAKRAAALSGQPWLYHYVDYLYAIVRYGVGERQYVTSGFYKLRSFDRRKTYTWQRRNELRDLFNKKEDRHLLAEKGEFNALFKEFIHRDWLDCEQASAQEIEAFLARHGRVIAKPVGNTKGRGIHTLDYDPAAAPAEAAQLAGTRVMLEEYLKQHPLMCFDNRSVNTLRINTVLDSRGEVHVIKSCLRCGVGDALVDNFSAGGVFYPVHNECGCIEGPGASLDLGQQVYVHPGTDIFMPGRVIPHWKEALAMVEAAARKVPTLRLVGWDVAILPDGPELIEGNTKPGENLLEAQGGEKGLYYKILSYR